MKKAVFSLILIFLVFSADTLFSQTLDFYQNNIIISNRDRLPDTTLNSYTGKVKLTFTSSDTLKYFNLTINGNGLFNFWTIRNYPVVSLDSNLLTENRYFSLPIADSLTGGNNITSLDYGYSLTSDSAVSPPTVNYTASVNNFDIIIFNGVIDNRLESIENLQIKNNTEFDNIFLTGKTQPGYPIQNCNIGEGFPEAVSNAAFYIKKLNPTLIPFDTTKITIEQIKIYSSWKNEGVYLVRTGSPVELQINNAFSINQVPLIMSAPFSPPETDADIQNIINALMNKDAVTFIIQTNYKNLNTGNQILYTDLIDLREISKVKNDLYTFTYSKDQKQGSPGGNIIESGYFIPSTSMIIWSSYDSLSKDPLYFHDLGGYYINKGDPPLPIELLNFNFTVDNRNVELIWSTKQENNNKGFEIERMNVSKNNEEWINIGFVKGTGIDKINNYNYYDRNLNSGKYKYRLKQIDFNGNYNLYELATEVSIGIPERYYVSQNYPNPFNPSTRINIDIPTNGNVRMKLFDIRGKELKTILDEYKTAGYYTIYFNLSELPTGVYYYKFEAFNYTLTKKIVLMK